jgi:hypothetical protein
MAMDAMLATIAIGGQEIYGINREAGRNKLIYCLIYHFRLNPLMAASANPFRRGTWSGVRRVLAFTTPSHILSPMFHWSWEYDSCLAK